MNWDPYLLLNTKFNLRCIKDLTQSLNIMKPLECVTEIFQANDRQGFCFVVTASKEQATETEMDQ